MNLSTLFVITWASAAPLPSPLSPSPSPASPSSSTAVSSTAASSTTSVPQAKSAVPAPATSPAAADVAAPMRWLLLPLVLDGVDATAEVTNAIAIGHKDVIITGSTCGDAAACQTEARLKGMDQLLTVRLRRMTDVDVVVVAELATRDGAGVARSVDIGTTTTIASTSRFAIDRLVTRALRARAAALDPDSDGVTGADDACPTVVGQATARGCPDGDGDGVADGDDQCPAQKGAPTARGCAPADDVALVKPDVVKRPTEKSGPEWGRIVGGSSAGFFGAILGGAAGVGITYLIKAEVEQAAGGTSTEVGTALFYGTGAGLGALVGTLAPDVSCAGLCGYPLAASGWTRGISALLVGGTAGAGAALGAVAFNKQDQEGLIAGGALLAAAPVLGGLTVAAGNCISGPPAE